jgi:hypothetical protein
MYEVDTVIKENCDMQYAITSIYLIYNRGLFRKGKGKVKTKCLKI